MESEARVRITGQFVLGAAIVIVGVLFTLDNLDILDARDYLRFWPVVLVSIGLIQMTQARTAAGVIGGAIWMLVGGVLLGNRLGILHANLLAFWPLLLVLVGARIVWQAYSIGVAGARALDTSAVVSAMAVMGGFDRRIVSKEFRGGELTAFMGGGKLDLREAAPADGQMIVNLFAIMGGFEIVVPETWSLSLEVMPFMGGVEDKTRPPATPSAPCLIVRGFVMMSGVEIKN